MVLFFNLVNFVPCNCLFSGQLESNKTGLLTMAKTNIQFYHYICIRNKRRKIGLKGRIVD